MFTVVSRDYANVHDLCWFVSVGLHLQTGDSVVGMNEREEDVSKNYSLCAGGQPVGVALFVCGDWLPTGRRGTAVRGAARTSHTALQWRSEPTKTMTYVTSNNE